MLTGSLKNKIQETCIKFVLPSDERSTAGLVDYFSKYSLYKEIKNKKIIEVNVTDFFITENERYIHYAKFNFIHCEMIRLQFTSDTSTVFKIELGDENTYGEFVWIINQCMLYDYKRYAFADNNFYLFPNPPTPTLLRKALLYLDSIPIFEEAF